MPLPADLLLFTSSASHPFTAADLGDLGFLSAYGVSVYAEGSVVYGTDEHAIVFDGQPLYSYAGWFLTAGTYLDANPMFYGSVYWPASWVGYMGSNGHTTWAQYSAPAYVSGSDGYWDGYHNEWAGRGWWGGGYYLDPMGWAGFAAGDYWGNAYQDFGSAWFGWSGGFYGYGQYDWNAGLYNSAWNPYGGGAGWGYTGLAGWGWDNYLYTAGGWYGYTGLAGYGPYYAYAWYSGYPYSPWGYSVDVGVDVKGDLAGEQNTVEWLNSAIDTGASILETAQNLAPAVILAATGNAKLAVAAGFGAIALAEVGASVKNDPNVTGNDFTPIADQGRSLAPLQSPISDGAWTTMPRQNADDPIPLTRIAAGNLVQGLQGKERQEKEWQIAGEAARQLAWLQYFKKVWKALRPNDPLPTPIPPPPDHGNDPDFDHFFDDNAKRIATASWHELLFPDTSAPVIRAFTQGEQAFSDKWMREHEIDWAFRPENVNNPEAGKIRGRAYYAAGTMFSPYLPPPPRQDVQAVMEFFGAFTPMAPVVFAASGAVDIANGDTDSGIAKIAGSILSAVAEVWRSPERL